MRKFENKKIGGEKQNLRNQFSNFQCSNNQSLTGGEKAKSSETNSPISQFSNFFHNQPPNTPILYLAHRIPYPPNKGDKIRSFNQIKYLSEAGYEIHLVCLADQEQDLQYKKELEQWCKSVKVDYRPQNRAKLLAIPWLVTPLPLSVPCFYSRRLQAEVDRLLNQENIRIVICFSSVMGEYLLRSKDTTLSEKLLIMDFCDLDSDKWQQYSRSANPPMSWIYSREASRLLHYEQTLNEFFDYSIFVSQPEADLFMPHARKQDRIRVVGNGVDHEFFSSSKEQVARSKAKGAKSKYQGSSIKDQEARIKHQGQAAKRLVFTGAMDYQANVDGILWFCRSVWPGLQSKLPGLRLYIVGANPVPEVRQLAGENIKVTGYVKDIREYYHLADVSVIPLRLARGVQNKMLEAMSMGKPVVTTSRVLQGIQARPEQDLLLAGSSQEFERQVLRLCEDPDLGRELGQRGREFVLRHYDWQRNLKGMEDILQATPDFSRTRPGQAGSRLNPVYFFALVLFILVASLWPMQPTSPGAGLAYRIDPGLQNVLHLPVFAAFAWLLLDFLESYNLRSRHRYGLFTISGLGFCLVLEWLQLFIPGRFPGLEDIVFNLVGLALGGGFYLLMIKRVPGPRMLTNRHEHIP